ncbi:MAG: hypothetical protein SVW57_05170 [Thermodesulfobacteriota bacterium]|nr:hypothetical protein [Thermodesulfobacteriota bacterium]
MKFIIVSIHILRKWTTLLGTKKKGTVQLIIGLCILTSFASCTGDLTALEPKHPLSDKIGFSLSGELEEGIKVSYNVKRRHPLSFQPMEEVIFTKNENTNILIDYDANGKVDRILLGESNELIGRIFSGLQLRYNESTLTEAKAREIIHDADRIFNSVKVKLKVNTHIKLYTKTVKNPFR